MFKRTLKTVPVIPAAGDMPLRAEEQCGRFTVPDGVSLEDAAQELWRKNDELTRCNAHLRREAEEGASALRALHRMEARYRDFFDKAGKGIAQWRPDGRLITANDSCAVMLGFTSSEELRTAYAEGNFSLCEDKGETAFLCAELERKDVLEGFEARLHRQGESVFWGRINAHRVVTSNGDTDYYEIFVEDITEKKTWEDRLTYLAFYDPLTGLANRALFENRLEMILKREARRPTAPFAVLSLDLARFKVVNDVYGHKAGDEVLRLAAARLCSCVREEDTVARFVADEFLILMENVHRRSVVVAVARRIYEALHAPFLLDGRNVHIGVSMGIVLWDKRYSRPEEVLRDADIAMYRAKIDQRRSVRFFNERMRLERVTSTTLEKDLREGKRNSEFYFEYQPIVDLRKNAICGFEALMRWRRGEGVVSPATFIPVAEKTGLIKSIGQQMLELACGQVAAWQDKGFDSFTTHVNISAVQLEDPGFIRAMRQIFAKTGVDPGQLCFEITESILLDGGNVHMRGITQLRALGVRFCLDDFGTGFSSLSYLRRLPIDSIKLDRSFVAEFETDPKALAVARNLIRLGRELDLKVVVEGVERATQAVLLNSIGAGFVQGFYYYRPMEPPAAERLLVATAAVGM